MPSPACNSSTGISSANNSADSGRFPIISEPVCSRCDRPEGETSKILILPLPLGSSLTSFDMLSATSLNVQVLGSKNECVAYTPDQSTFPIMSRRWCLTSSLLCLPVQTTFSDFFVSNSMILISSNS